MCKISGVAVIHGEQKIAEESDLEDGRQSPPLEDRQNENLTTFELFPGKVVLVYDGDYIEKILKLIIIEILASFSSNLIVQTHDSQILISN